VLVVVIQGDEQGIDEKMARPVFVGIEEADAVLFSCRWFVMV